MEKRAMESGIQLFSRMNSKNTESLNGINPYLFPEGGPYGNQIIEISFEEGIDYTDILIDFIIKAVLPTKFCKEFKCVQVILLNTDFQINLFKIIKFIEKKLADYNVKDEKQSLVEQALKNIVILNCYTLERLQATFYSLEKIINNCKNVGLVILDNILSHYWNSKFYKDTLSFDEHSNIILDALYNRIRDMNVVLIYGKPGVKECKKVSPKINYNIHVSRCGEGFLMKINHFEKDTSISVQFNILDICPVYTHPGIIQK